MFSALTTCIVAAAPASSFKADALPLFAGCESKSDTSSGRSYACPDWSASFHVLPAPGTLTDEQAWETLRRTMHMLVPDGFREERILLPGGDAGRPALRFTLPRTAPYAFSIDTFVRGEGGRVRTMSCAGEAFDRASTERCTAVLEYLASKGPPDEVRLEEPHPAPTPVLLGRTLTVPKGCTLANADVAYGRIQCPGVSFSWTIVPMPFDVETVTTQVATGLMNNLGLTVGPERVACTIGGVRARCARLSKPAVDLVSHIGAIADGNSTVSVVCTARPAAKPFPEACNGVMALLPQEE